MLKRMLILTMVLTFAMSGVSFAGAVALSDKAMDGVSAGDWVIVKDTEGNETVADVYTTNNTLWLLEDSQKDIKAVSNANAIDSAVAVQSNIARVSSANQPTTNVAVNGSNTADLTNYRPSSSSSSSDKSVAETATSSAKTSGSASQSAFALNSTSAQTSSSSSSASSAAVFDYDETLDIDASITGDSKDIGKGGITGGSIDGSLDVDYDKTIDASAVAASASASASAKSCVLGITETSASSTYATEDVDSSSTTTTEHSQSSRDSKGANNHILLDATSQQSIQAVSNLNAVGAGVAVQNNIASNVGVSGTITHVNSAAVSSGF